MTAFCSPLSCRVNFSSDIRLEWAEPVLMQTWEPGREVGSWPCHPDKQRSSVHTPGLPLLAQQQWPLLDERPPRPGQPPCSTPTGLGQMRVESCCSNDSTWDVSRDTGSSHVLTSLPSRTYHTSPRHWSTLFSTGAMPPFSMHPKILRLTCGSV